MPDDTITINTPNSEVWSHLAQAVTLDSTEHAAELLSHCGTDRLAYIDEMLLRLTASVAAARMIQHIQDGDVFIVTVRELLDAVEDDSDK